MYKLVISDDEGKSIIVPLVRDLITIGRQEGNTIRLTERNVSRQHARLVKVDDHFRIEDLDAYNGVRVNDERVKGARDLTDGDRIRIGDYLLDVRVEAGIGATRPQGLKKPPPPPTAGSATLPARLVMVSAPAPGAEFSITRDTVRVGRLEELELCISHRSISREHAQIERSGGDFQIRDLDSANGVRVNGTQVKSSPLASGDLIDLGQVRFRFVGPGEAYAYEADEVHSAVEGLSALPTQSHLRTAVIVGSAVVIAGALALWGTEDPEAVSLQTEPSAAADVAIAEEGRDPSEVRAQVEAALERCAEAREAGRYEEAAKSAQNGLMLAEDHEGLRKCRDGAMAGVREAQAFQQGKAAYEAGDVDAAFLLLAGLAQDSPLRREAVVIDVVRAYARKQLNEAESQLPRDPASAARLASEVEGMGEAGDALQGQARELRLKAQRAARGGGDHAGHRDRRRPTSRNTPVERAAATASPVKEREPDRDLTPTESPAKQARACLARGDQKCAVRALEGRARSAQELALLVETYRALGDTRRAVRSMQLFVKRFPTAPQASGYRTFIARNNP